MECIAEIFQSLKQNKITEEELYKIKQYYAGQFRSGFDGPFAMNSKVQHLIYRSLPNDYYNTILPSIWAISAEEIMETANNYLHTTSFITVLSGDTSA
jgi:predicted Zn-dependent peptidase